MASTHEVDRKYPCPYCPATFKRKDNADRHVTDTHSLVTELFECDVCGGRFQSASRLKQHAKLHHDESVRRPCHLCGKIMLARNLLVHLRRTHFDRKDRIHCSTNLHGHDVDGILWPKCRHFRKCQIKCLAFSSTH